MAKIVDQRFPEKPVISMLSDLGIDQIIKEIQREIPDSGRAKI